MEPKKIKKLYYSIGEVSQITSLKKHVLRFWESEFGELKPAKNRAGKRTYKINDIRTIFFIKKLLYEDKFTLEGAKKRLRTLKQNHEPQLKLSLSELRTQDALADVKRELRELLSYLTPPAGETDGPAQKEPGESSETV